MKLNSSYTNTLLSTTTASVNEKPSANIEKLYPNNNKMIKIKLQTLLLMMMLNN